MNKPTDKDYARLVILSLTVFVLLCTYLMHSIFSWYAKTHTSEETAVLAIVIIFSIPLLWLLFHFVLALKSLYKIIKYKYRGKLEVSS